jgi:DNA mismatch endonuclease (patch repair protein)
MIFKTYPMTDIISKEKRSWNMSRIKGKNTKPEILVRSFLHKAGFRFRINDERLTGKPDIVFPKYHTVVFIHGCFWHRHKNCRKAYFPKTRVSFWKKKFSANVKRDYKVMKNLKKLGWKVCIVWECKIEKNLKAEIDKIADLVTKQ